MPYDVPAGNSIHADLGGDYGAICGACLDFRLGDEPQVCEIWRPALANAVDLDLLDGYVVAAGNELDFSFQPLCYPEYGPGIILPCGEDGEIALYTAPAGNTVVIDIYGDYLAPAGNEIYLELVDCALDQPPKPPPPWYHIPSGISSGISLGFQAGTPAERAVESPWGGARQVEPSVNTRFSSGRKIERLLDAAWQGLGQLYRSNRLAWDRLLVYDPRVQAVWSNLREFDRNRNCPYGAGVSRDESTDLLWLSPPEKDQLRVIGYGELPEQDRVDFDIPWGNPPPRDRLHNTCWGPKYYEEICSRDYLPMPGNAIDLDIGKPIEEVGDKDHVDVWFEVLSYDERCKHREPSGWRDAYTYVPPPLIPWGVVKRCYVMNNLATLTRVSDSAPIQAKSLSLSCDMDSWGWQLNAGLDVGQDIALVDPSVAGPVEVEAVINGHTWRAQVDGWNNNRVFSGSGRRAVGRSLSAELAAPGATPLTYVEASQRTARQLAEDVLLNSGWTLDWQLVDWLVPGGILSVENQTPMQVLKRIAESSGGFVYTHMETATIHILPRWSAMPWEFATATPDMIIPESMIESIGSDWQPRPAYNAAFVSGTVDGGKSAKITRSGTAGDKAAGMVTEPLLTAIESLTAKGKAVLAESGDRFLVRLVMPLFTPPETPGVLLPGMLIEISGDQSWKGLVLSNSVSAVWNRALVVRQTVELVKYHGT